MPAKVVEAAVLQECVRTIGNGDACDVAILTISDAGARGERADTSGDAIVAWAANRGDAVVERDARA